MFATPIGSTEGHSPWTRASSARCWAACAGHAGGFGLYRWTALIHSMEGRRGEPTVKPPYPSESGYKGYPTNVNNVETYANIPPIILRGAEWFSSIGTEKSKGTKVFALAGKVNNVGLIEVPMGTTLREVIFEIGGGIKNGKKFKAVQTGGPSGGCLTEKHLDTPIDYDNLLASGSMMGSGGMIQGKFFVRSGPDGAQPVLHPQVLPGRICGPCGGQKCPAGVCKSLLSLRNRRGQVQGLYRMFARLPGRRDLRHGGRTPCHRHLKVHQVRSLHGKECRFGAIVKG